jgi:hypothetical protein
MQATRILSSEPLPDLSPEEFSDLQRESGLPFLSSDQAQRYRVSQLKNQAVSSMLADAGSR